jgi:hypothetical protein
MALPVVEVNPIPGHRSARYSGPCSKDATRVGLRTELRLVEAQPRRGRVEVAEVGTAKGRLRHPRGRQTQAPVQRPLRRVPFEGPPPEARDPDAAFSIHAKAVRDSITRWPDQMSAPADGAVTEIVVENVMA